MPREHRQTGQERVLPAKPSSFLAPITSQHYHQTRNLSMDKLLTNSEPSRSNYANCDCIYHLRIQDLNTGGFGGHIIVKLFLVLVLNQLLL